jgi:hypothetical protein
MLFNLVLVIIILSSLVIIICIIVRKFPFLLKIDLEQIPEERKIRIKKAILEKKIIYFVEEGQKKIREKSLIWKNIFLIFFKKTLIFLKKPLQFIKKILFR